MNENVRFYFIDFAIGFIFLNKSWIPQNNSFVIIFIILVLGVFFPVHNLSIIRKC